MKKALNLIVMYLITLLSGVVVGTVLYSFYINVLNFVAGTEIQFFTKYEILNAFFYITFCILFILCPLTAYYKIRHPGGIPQMITFFCLSILTWAVLIPVFYKVKNNYVEKYYSYEERPLISKGYFRQVGNKVYYFTKDFSENPQGELESNVVIINTEENGDVYSQKVINSPNLPVYKIAEPYREILIKNTFHTDDFPLSINFEYLIDKGDYNLNNGLLPYLGFLSIGLVLCSIFALTSLFHWKLLNALLLTILSFAFLLINTHPEMLHFSFLQEKIGNSGFYRFLGSFGLEPIVFFLNVVCALGFITTGVVIYFVRRHRLNKKNG